MCARRQGHFNTRGDRNHRESGGSGYLNIWDQHRFIIHPITHAPLEPEEPLPNGRTNGEAEILLNGQTHTESERRTDGPFCS